jgi:hypothetical protein
MVSAATEVHPALEAPEPGPRRPALLDQLPYLVLPSAALALWAWSAPATRMGAMNDLGLISVLTWQTWLAFGLLTLGFIACWRRAEPAAWLLFLHVLLLVVMLYGLPALITHEPSGPVVFRHSGITENLIRTRVVNTKIDAYFSWPGFFMGLASLVKIAGAPNALTFATWAPVAFNLLYLPPLLLLARSLTRDPRLVWGAIWLFFATNWIDQDYLAPQAFSYMLYLTILGLLLTYLRPRGSDIGEGGWLTRRLCAILRVRPGEVPPREPSRWTAAAVLAVVVLAYTTTVASHQLTPFALVIGVTALVFIGQCSARGLPLLMAVIVALWVTFVAHGYVSGHFGQMISGFGDLGKDTSANVTSRISGSPQHLVVVRERLLLSGGLWLLALLGAARRFRLGFADHAPAVLFLAPLSLFPMQPYGGEMLMRIYFFMLPFAAFFAAAALVPSRAQDAEEISRLPYAVRYGAAVMAFSLTVAVVLASCLLARFGNERADYFTPGERDAIRYLYSRALPGSTFAVEQAYLPWKYQGYDEHKYLSVDSMLSQRHPPTPALALRRISLALRAVPGRPAGFVVLTRSQHAYAEIFGGVLSHSYVAQFEQMLRTSPQFQLIYSNSDAQIYLRTPG